MILPVSFAPSAMPATNQSCCEAQTNCDGESSVANSIERAALRSGSAGGLAANVTAENGLAWLFMLKPSQLSRRANAASNALCPVSLAAAGRKAMMDGLKRVNFPGPRVIANGAGLVAMFQQIHNRV